MALAFALAAVLALVDWVGVVRGDRRLRWIGKPGVMLALIAAALLTDDAPPAVRAWFVAALVLSLIGDVALLLPERWFIVGLGAFLLAHMAYIGGMVQLDLHWAWGALVVVIAAALVGPVIVRGGQDRSPLPARPGRRLPGGDLGHGHHGVVHPRGVARRRRDAVLRFGRHVGLGSLRHTDPDASNRALQPGPGAPRWPSW